MNWMIKNSAGKPDGVWTLTVVSFIVTTLSVILAMFKTIHIGSLAIEIAEPNTAFLTFYMGLAGTGYIIRRNKKDNLEAGVAE